MAGRSKWLMCHLVSAVLLLGISALLTILLLSHNHASAQSLTNHRSSSTHLDRRYTNQTSFDLSSCDAEHSCPADQCCDGSGICGYGPEHCGGSCVSNCQATSECGQFASSPGKHCPLNVCCSKAGFCGTSTEHCSGSCQSNCVEHPDPIMPKSKADVRNRVIGYYDASSANRDCHPMSPSQIPIDQLTHVNFAFASIEPETYLLTTMDTTTSSKLFQTVADISALRSDNLDVEVWVTVGGWVFSKNDSLTQPLFGQIASDNSKRKAFAENVVRFLDQYGFNGLDIDWQYPGVPDRGGTMSDTQAYVLLVKAIRDAFNASPRRLGLSVTIPSSYQLLRWFDLQGMSPYVDWFNFMAYDLDGVWDHATPAGSLVKAHTNLTQIKSATELLWRAQVPASKVVFGICFYGRAVQLADTHCDYPGCQVGGMATPGNCTGTEGVLGYFEIIDALYTNTSGAASISSTSRRKIIEPVHDRDAAVKYFKFNGDQWVSYDDDTTMKQKIEWANEVGMGGIMIWATDLDDKSNSALSGLTQQSRLAAFNGNHSIKALDQFWSGENGQQCYQRNDDCTSSDVMTCDPGEFMIGWEGHGCSVGSGQPFCCPVDAYPRQCIWRGGEPGHDDCNGHCLEGEVPLFESEWGGGFNSEFDSQDKCGFNRKVFCCKSDHFYDLVKQCQWSACDGVCPDGKSSVGTAYNAQNCTAEPHLAQFCCPIQQFEWCGWAGSGDCTDNVCGTGLIQVTQDAFGDSPEACPEGRMKALCCSNPVGPLFIPPDFDSMFPEPVPGTDEFHYKITILEGEEPGVSGDMSTAGGFGMIVFEGASSAVTSAKVKRDGRASDLHFLDCSPPDEAELFKARFVCLADDIDHDCHDMLEGGIEGTIMEMPHNCDSDPYAVVRSLSLSTNQTLPLELMDIRNTTVMELSLDYNFGLVKRDAGEVNFRLDFSTMDGYWDLMIEGNSENGLRRRASANREDWIRELKLLLESHKNNGLNRTIGLPSYPLLAEFLECDGEETFAVAKISGWVDAQIQAAAMLRGTVVPQVEILEPLLYLKATLETNVYIQQSYKGKLLLNLIQRGLAGTSFPGFSQRGIAAINPRLQIDIFGDADIDLVSNLTAGVHGRTNVSLEQGFPDDVIPRSGQTVIEPYDKSFFGSVEQVKQSGHVMLGVAARVFFGVEVDDYNTGTKRIGAQPEAEFQVISQLDVNEKDEYKMTVSSSPGFGNLSYDTDSPDRINQWIDGQDQLRVFGDSSAPVVLASGQVGAAPDPNDPSPGADPTDFDLDGPLDSAKPLICGTTIPPKCKLKEHSCAFDICQDDPGLCLDGEDNVIDGDDFVVRARRPYDVDLGDGLGKLTIKSQDAPSVGQLFKKAEGSQVLRMDFQYFSDDCTDTAIEGYLIDDPDSYNFKSRVTEHVVELQTIKLFLQCVTSGKLPSGGQLDPNYMVSAGWFRSYWNTYSIRQPLEGVFGPYSYSPTIPNDRVFEALGSQLSRWNFVVAGSELNGVKARIWQRKNPRDPDRFSLDVHNWLYQCKDAGKFLKYLKATRAVFDYLSWTDEVREKWVDTSKVVGTQLELIEANVPGAPGLANAWDEFFGDFRKTISQFAQDWMDDRIDDALDQIEEARRSPMVKTAENIEIVMGILLDLRRQVDSIDIV